MKLSFASVSLVSFLFVAQATCDIYAGIAIDGNGVGKRAACNADNCARAVTGTFQGLQSQRLEACSSFAQCTVFPATVTISTTAITTPATVTSTTLTTQTVETTTTLVKRFNSLDTRPAILVNTVTTHSAITVCPTSLPTTASACSGAIRFLSACSCAGYTRNFITMSTPSVIVTISATAATPTTVVTATTTTVDVATTTAVVPTAFFLQAVVGPNSQSGAAQYNGTYLKLDNSFGEMSSAPKSAAQSFMLDANSEIVNAGSTGSGSDRVYVLVPVSAGTVVVWDTRSHYSASGVSFSFGTGHAVLSAQYPGYFELQYNNAPPITTICDASQWNNIGGSGTRSDQFVMLFQNGNSQAGCYPVTLILQPLS